MFYWYEFYYFLAFLFHVTFHCLCNYICFIKFVSCLFLPSKTPSLKSSDISIDIFRKSKYLFREWASPENVHISSVDDSGISSGVIVDFPYGWYYFRFKTFHWSKFIFEFHGGKKKNSKISTGGKTKGGNAIGWEKKCWDFSSKGFNILEKPNLNLVFQIISKF